MKTRHNPTPGSAPPSPMVALQNRWYNGVLGALLLDPFTFQLVQPSGPISATDSALWSWLDVIPPASLTFNRSLPGGRRLFDQYASMVSQLQSPQTALEQHIGAENHRAWAAFLAMQPPVQSAQQLALLFHNWAARNAPAVASAGVSFLARSALIDTPPQGLAAYQGPNAKPAAFLGTYADLLQTLQRSSGANLSFDSSRISGDVSQTWPGGVDTGFDGLWLGSGSESRLTRQFAASRVNVTARFQAYAHWTAVPGPWYSSSLLNAAYSNRTTPPWVANANPSWDDLFGPGGSMLRMLASIVAVDGGKITVTSDAVFDATDHQTILDHAPLGLWPFYVPTIAGAVSNSVKFATGQGIEIEIVTEPGNPLVVGANVLAIARYLGHAAR